MWNSPSPRYCNPQLHLISDTPILGRSFSVGLSNGILPESVSHQQASLFGLIPVRTCSCPHFSVVLHCLEPLSYAERTRRVGPSGPTALQTALLVCSVPDQCICVFACKDQCACHTLRVFVCVHTHVSANVCRCICERAHTCVYCGCVYMWMYRGVYLSVCLYVACGTGVCVREYTGLCVWVCIFTGCERRSVCVPVQDMTVQVCVCITVQVMSVWVFVGVCVSVWAVCV